MAMQTVDPQIKLPQLPARELGFKNAPAFPVDGVGMLDTLIRRRTRINRSARHRRAQTTRRDHAGASHL
jgi:hypothetical protein